MDMFAWYVIRSSGAVSLMLLTASVALGVAARAHWTPDRQPRWVTRKLHRNVSLLSIVFLAIHVLISVIQTHANVSLANVAIPFAGTSHDLSLALGTVAVDLLLAIAITSAIRRYIGARAWRAVHLTSWAMWPIAAVHGVMMGTDSGGWMLLVLALCATTFVAAGWTRLAASRPQPAAR